MRRLIVFILLAFAALASIAETAPQSFEGSWTGAIKLTDGQLPVLVDLHQEGDRWTGVVSFPTQNVFDLPIERAQITNDEFLLRVGGIPGGLTFLGKFEGERITGTYKQQGGDYRFILQRKKE